MVSQDGSDLSGRKEKHSWKTFSLLFLGQFDVTLAAEKRRRGNWSTRSDKGQNGRDPCHFPYVFFPQKDISCFESCVCGNVARKLHRKLLHADPVSWFSPLFFFSFRYFTFSRTKWFKRIVGQSPSKYSSQKKKECRDHVAGSNSKHLRPSFLCTARASPGRDVLQGLSLYLGS